MALDERRAWFTSDFETVTDETFSESHLSMIEGFDFWAADVQDVQVSLGWIRGVVKKRVLYLEGLGEQIETVKDEILVWAEENRVERVVVDVIDEQKNRIGSFETSLEEFTNGDVMSLLARESVYNRLTKRRSPDVRVQSHHRRSR